MIGTSLRSLRFVPDGQKWRLWVLGVLILGNAVLEAAGIALVLPLIGLAGDPGRVNSMPTLAGIYRLTGLDSPATFVIASGLALLGVIAFKNVYALFTMRFQGNLIYRSSALVASGLFRRYLEAPYAFHLSRNSAELITRLDATVHNVFAGAVLGTLGVVTETVMVGAIITFLLIANPVLTLTAGAVLGVCMAGVFLFSRRRMTLYGEQSMRLRETRLQCLQQSLSSIKEVAVLGRTGFFRKQFEGISETYADSLIGASVLGQMPRLIIETILVAIIVTALLAAMINGFDGAELTGALAVFAAATFRLVPSLNRLLMALNNIKFSQPAVTELDMEFSDPAIAGSARPPAIPATAGHFTGLIEVRDLWFSYGPDLPPVLKGISLTIARGESIGFVSPSGAGKSTAIDIILGLLRPGSGQVLVDGRDISADPSGWQLQVGYVPQSVSLVDDSLRNNVAFALPPEEIDDARVWRALEMAELASFAEALPERLNTFVGERGVRLSGGQRQRIGIARALYHDPQVLVLDEATSALDNQTEREICASIDALRGGKTLLMIAHRLSTVRRCDRIVLMKDGGIEAQGTFEDLLATSEHFRHLVNLAELVAQAPEDANVLQ